MLVSQSGDTGRRTIVVVRRVLLNLFLPLCAAAAGGCAAYTEVEAEVVVVPAYFSRTGEPAMPLKWWTTFRSNALDGHVDRALSNNLSLASARARLDEAATLVRRQRSELFPQVDGIAEGRRIETDGDDQTDLSLGLAASYEVDLWGRIRADVAAERLQALATASDLQTAAVTLSAQVAETWFSLIVAQQQLDLLASQLETNTTVLTVLERRFAAGQSGSADVLRQRQLVEASRGQIVVAESQVAVLEHQLAVLEGEAPSRQMSVPDDLPTMPPLPATGVPAALVQRRPDVVAARQRLASADRSLAAAVRDQYPRLDLTASLTTAAERPADLFEEWIASIAAGLVAPLIDGGLRRAEVERTEAIRRQLLYDYGQSVLIALQDVEDALVLEAAQIRLIDSLTVQRDLAESTYDQLRNQYLNGAADFLAVLSALQAQQQIERDVLEAVRQRVIFRIGLYRALAGGFELPPYAEESSRE